MAVFSEDLAVARHFVATHPPTLPPSHPPTLPPSHPPTLPPSHPPTLPPSHPLTLSSRGSNLGSFLGVRYQQQESTLAIIPACVAC